MYKIAKSNLPALFRAIAETKELYLPIRRAGQVNFGPWSEDAEVDVETLKTVKSPKDVFFPQSENLYSCEREGKDIKIEPQALQDQEFVVFGMKACDIKGVEVLDKVFLADPIDTFYAARRDHGIIVAMACHEPEESCFCKVFGVDCADPEKSAADVAVWMLGDDLICIFQDSVKFQIIMVIKLIVVNAHIYLMHFISIVPRLRCMDRFHSPV